MLYPIKITSHSWLDCSDTSAYIWMNSNRIIQFAFSYWITRVQYHKLIDKWILTKFMTQGSWGSVLITRQSNSFISFQLKADKNVHSTNTCNGPHFPLYNKLTIFPTLHIFAWKWIDVCIYQYHTGNITVITEDQWCRILSWDSCKHLYIDHKLDHHQMVCHVNESHDVGSVLWPSCHLE